MRFTLHKRALLASRSLRYLVAVVAVTCAIPVAGAGAHLLTPKDSSAGSLSSPAIPTATTAFDVGLAFPTDVEPAPVVPAPQGGGISPFFILLSLGGFAIGVALLGRQWYTSRVIVTPARPR
jgi:hypothetical protein